MSYPQNPLVIDKIRKIRQDHLNKIINQEQGKIWSNVTENDKNMKITIVIPSRGCSWALSENSGCSVCGYINDSSRGKPIPV